MVYAVPDWEISGSSTGWFSNATGGRGLVSNLRGDETGNFFQWGDPRNWGTGANWLHFAGTEYNDVSAGDRFRIGALSYYNGTISMDSAATGIDFSVQLDFGGTPVEFDYQFDLLTTANTNNAIESADYVWFNDPDIDSLSVGTKSAQTINLYGIDYSLNLEFGETSDFGFSSIDQFHVMEARSASASLYATLISVGSWW